MKQLFGTDGIRGKAGAFPLDRDSVWTIGHALAGYFCNQDKRRPKFLLGRDTRESGPHIEAAFAGGAISGGAECETAGVITTPGVAYLTKMYEFDAGIVISASHNPFGDNGIKLFSRSGKKLGREVEEVIEAELHESPPSEASLAELDPSNVGMYQESYLSHFLNDFGRLNLNGIKLVVDCANGSASDLAPKLLRQLGASVIAIHDRPDGRNINSNCGSLHLADLSKKVVSEGADLGVAFDGDADRSLFIDEKGAIVDGDATLWIMANHFQRDAQLKDSSVVATVMSNIGLELALSRISVSLVRTDVGDKYVLSELIKSGLSIGGEQSGHIIFPGRTLVGDGIQTTLYLLEAAVSSGKSVSELTRGFESFPQILLNVPVARKVPFEQVEEIADAQRLLEDELGNDGRLLLRYSGTENLARVMIEGKDQKEIEVMARHLASKIEKALG